MRRIVLDIHNVLFSDSIRKALNRYGSDFDVTISEKPDQTVMLCNITQPYALVMEVTGYETWSLPKRLELRKTVLENSPQSKIVILVDENSEEKLAEDVKQLKKDGLIDQFIFASISTTYLAALIDTL